MSGPGIVTQGTQRCCAPARSDHDRLARARPAARRRGLGPATLLQGEPARVMNRRILERYLTPAGVAAADVGQKIAASDDVTIRIEVGTWRTWSPSEDFDGRLEAPGMSLPLEH